jgi:hypothetical protein
VVPPDPPRRVYDDVVLALTRSTWAVGGYVLGAELRFMGLVALVSRDRCVGVFRPTASTVSKDLAVRLFL